MKRKLAVLLLVMMLLTISIVTFCACDNKSPREVEIEIINPLSGKAFEQDETIELPNEETLIEVRVKDKKKGKYLTDKDFEDKALAECLKISVSRLWKYEYKEKLNSEGKLPIEKESVVTSNYYEIEVTFETKPSNIKEEEYERKYEAKTQTVNFYSNKDWKGTDYFELVSATSEFFNGEYDDYSDLAEKVDNLQQLNVLIDDLMFSDKIHEAIGNFEKYDKDYFKEKSLLIIICISGTPEKHDLEKICIEDKILTVSLIKPQSNDIVLPIVSSITYIIEIKKEAIGEFEKIKVEHIIR